MATTKRSRSVLLQIVEEIDEEPVFHKKSKEDEKGDFAQRKKSTKKSRASVDAMPAIKDVVLDDVSKQSKVVKPSESIWTQAQEETKQSEVSDSGKSTLILANIDVPDAAKLTRLDQPNKIVTRSSRRVSAPDAIKLPRVQKPRKVNHVDKIKKEVPERTQIAAGKETSVKNDEKWRRSIGPEGTTSIGSNENTLTWSIVRKVYPNLIAVPAKNFNHPYADLMKQIEEGLGNTTFLWRWATIEKKGAARKDIEHVCWPVVVIEAEGLYLKLQICGSDKCFWANVMSEEVQAFGDTKMKISAPPKVQEAIPDKDEQLSIVKKILTEKCGVDQKFIEARRQFKEGINKYRVGQRVELVDTGYSNRVRVAEVMKTAGRRALFKVTDKYFDMSGPNVDPNSEQAEDGRNWLDHDSPLVHHVGWASLNGYNIVVRKETGYEEHAEKVAKALKEFEDPPYENIDATLEQAMKFVKSSQRYKLFKVGMKLEYLDIIDGGVSAKKFLKIGTITKIFKNHFLLVSEDNATDEVLPFHASSPYIFPPGYAAKYGIQVIEPIREKVVKRFDWNAYVKKVGGSLAPKEAFEEVERGIEKIFPIGACIEATCHSESNLYFSGIVRAIHGRLLKITYHGYEDDDFQLFDYRGGDIWPVGHAEGFGFKLHK